MGARDDYPIERTEVLYSIDPGRWKDMCDEIDRLRNANKFLSDILDDVLPTVTLTSPLSVMKIDDRWMRVIIEPKEPT